MIGVALLGAGFMGSMHLRAWAAHDTRCRVVTVQSRSATKAVRLAGVVNARAATDVDEAVNSPGVDVVDVCLPTPQHRPAVERALDAGKHVLVEKPIALTVEDAELMRASADRSRRLLQVGHVLRFWPAYEQLHAAVADGSVGRVRTVRTRRLSGPPDWSDWLVDPRESGGVAIDLLVHDFDQTNTLLGHAAWVTAWPIGSAGALRHVLAHVEYHEGDAWVEGSTAMPPGFSFESSIEVLGDGGVARYQFASDPPAPGEGNIGAPSCQQRGLELYPITGASRVFAPSRSDPWVAQAGHFLDAIESGRPVQRGTAEQATSALRVALAVNRSLSSGRREAVFEVPGR